MAKSVIDLSVSPPATLTASLRRLERDNHVAEPTHPQTSLVTPSPSESYSVNPDDHQLGDLSIEVLEPITDYNPCLDRDEPQPVPERVRVEGEGFKSGSDVDIVLGMDTGENVEIPLATVTADAQGKIAAVLDLPTLNPDDPSGLTASGTGEMFEYLELVEILSLPASAYDCETD